ncbi:general substrate transporter [Sarocladium strictum]
MTGTLEPTSRSGKDDSAVDVHRHVETPIRPAEVAVEAADKGQATSGYEDLTLWETVSKFKFASIYCFIAAMSAAADGYQLSMSGNIVANKAFVAMFATETNAEGERYLASGILSGWSAAQNVCQIIGQTGHGFICARYGRKAGMLSLWTILVGSVFAETFSTDWKSWLVGRGLGGIGVGGLQTTILGYIAEVAPVRIRGALLMSYSFWWGIGTWCTHMALYAMNKQNPDDFRTPIYTQWGQIGLMAIIYLILPESPAWCATVGKEGKAKKALGRINRGVEDYDADYQYHVLSLALEHERAVAKEMKNEKWWAIFKGTDGRRTITALWTIVAQQFLGLALFGTFGTYFFQQAGIKDPFEVKAITSSVGTITIVAAMFLVDRYGRRLMACTMTTLMWICCVVVGILGVVPESGATLPVFILFTCLWNMGIAANGAAGWGYIGEISSQRLRPYTSGFAASANSLGGLIMTILTPFMVNANQWNWRYRTGWFYAGVGLPWVIGMWLLIPETAGRSSAELDELFERKIKPWRFHKVETATQALLRAEKAAEVVEKKEG